MTEQQPYTEDQVKALREKAKELGIKNWHNKKYETLYADTMAAIDAKNEEERVIAKPEPKPETFDQERFYFTNPQTGRIGEYIHLDKKNNIPHTEKGTAYKLLRWV